MCKLNYHALFYYRILLAAVIVPLCTFSNSVQVMDSKFTGIFRFFYL